MFKKTCSICKKDFETKYSNKNICDFSCRMEANRQNSRRLMRIRRNNKRASFPACEVCGWKLITQQHHEPNSLHNLCPNHHHLITRNYVTLEEMLKNPSQF